MESSAGVHERLNLSMTFEAFVVRDFITQCVAFGAAQHTFEIRM
jgi:hypothetical protein